MYIFEIMHPCDKKEDDKIVALIRQKNTLGIELLYDTYGGAIYGVILRLVEHKMTAEKVLSDTLIKIYHHIEDFEPEHFSFLSWSMNIARSLAKDHTFTDLNKNAGGSREPIFDLIVNKGLSVEVVATLLGISKAACAMKLRAELMTKSMK
nr:sigma factor [uncultured Pedobacter sp.]